MIIEAVFGALAEAILGTIIADLADRPIVAEIRERLLKGGSPEKVALQTALSLAYREFEKKHADLVESFFDEKFLTLPEVAKELSKVLIRNQSPSIEVLEGLWKSQFHYGSEKRFNEPIEFFVESFRNQAKAQTALRLFFDSQNFEEMVRLLTELVDLNRKNQNATPTQVTFTLDLSRDDFDEKRFVILVAGLARAGVGAIKVVDVRAGSTIVTLEMPRWNALELKLRLDQNPGALSEFRLFGFEIVGEDTYRAGAISADLYKRASRVQERPRKLIGRNAMLTEVRAMLDSGDQVLLRGFPGMGKTSLAAELAARWLEDQRGPVLWLKAGAAGANALFEALAWGFGADAARAVAGLPGEGARAKLVGDLLENNGVRLVVLDDCWSAPALHRVLQAIPRGIPALVTARQRYAVERLREVGELARADSLALFRYHSDSPSPAPSSARMERGLGGEVLASDAAATAQPTWDESANTLCDRLGDHAFAVEIAGKSCKARGLTPTDLLAQIKDAPHTLTAPLDYADRDRANLSALLEASLNVLEEEARNVFLAFGAFFAPRLTPEMLGIYNDLSESPAITPLQAPLTQLHDQGLIERVPAVPDVNVEYYNLHDLAYAYAAGEINPDARHRALDACLAYISRYNKPTLPNFAALRPELDGLLEAAKWAFEHDRYDDATRLANNFYFNGNRILDMQGFYAQVLNLYGWMLQAARARGNQQHEGVALGNLGNAYYSLGRYDEAITHHQQSLDIKRQIGDRLGEAKSLGNLGNAYYSLGRYDEAISYHQEDLTIARQLGDQRGEASALGGLGNAYNSLGRYDEAISHHQRWLTIARQLGDQRGEASALGGLGNVYNNLGRTDEAISHYQQWLTIARQLGYRSGEANALGNLGSVYNDLGRTDEAITQHQQALVIMREIGDRDGEGRALGNLGNSYFILGRTDEAISHYQMQITIARQIGNRRGEASALGGLGNAYNSLGRTDEAITQHQQALVIMREIGDRQAEASILGNMGIVYDSLGRTDKAIEQYQGKLTIARQIGDRRGEANALYNLGNAYNSLGRTDEAIGHFQQSLTIDRQIGYRKGEANTLGNLGIAYKNLGRYDEAIEQYQGKLTISHQIGDRLGEGQALNNLGSAFAEQSQYAQAVQYYEAARAIFATLGVPELAATERNLAQAREKMAGGS